MPYDVFSAKIALEKVYIPWAGVKSTKDAANFNRELGDGVLLPYSPFKMWLHHGQRGFNKSNRTIVSKGLAVVDKIDYSRVDKFKISAKGRDANTPKASSKDGKTWYFLGPNDTPKKVPLEVFTPHSEDADLEYSEQKGAKNPSAHVGQIWLWMYKNRDLLVVKGAYKVIDVQELERPFMRRYILSRV